MHRLYFSLVVALGVAGCNETMGGAGPIASAPLSVRDSVDARCGAEIDRFQAIVTSDHETGNVDQKVFDQIEGDLSRASAACAAGRGAEAHAIVAGSKARHGYRA